MQPRFLKQFTIAIALAGAACAAQAHRPWMIANTSMVDSEDGREAWVTIDAAVSENLFDADFIPLRLDGLTVTGPDGVTVPAPAAFVGKHRSTVDIPLPKDGTYRITLAVDKVMGSYKVNGDTKRFRATAQTFKNQIPPGAVDVRTSTTHQRQNTFVTLGKPGSAAHPPGEHDAPPQGAGYTDSATLDVLPG